MNTGILFLIFFFYLMIYECLNVCKYLKEKLDHFSCMIKVNSSINVGYYVKTKMLIFIICK